MPKRAAIYARVSKAYRQDDDRVTIAEQLSTCEARCSELGMVVVARYVDKDRYKSKGRLVDPSGMRKDRPGYLQMIRAARAREFDVVVTWKEDRLYRGMWGAVPFLELLDQRKDLDVVVVTGVFDRSMAEIKAAFAKMEADNIRDRMMMGRRARLERGEAPGGTLRYGYGRGEDGRLEIIEAEAVVVRTVFERYLAGENNMQIRQRLNAAGVQPRRARLWSKATIQNILTFEGYATGEYQASLDGERFVVPCPMIISQRVWDRALERREENKSYRGRNVKEDYLCRGMVVCPCGWKWTARTSHSPRSRPGKAGYYGCARKDHQPESVHPECPGTIGSQKLDDAVWRFVVTICEDPTIIQSAIECKAAALAAASEDLAAEAAKLQRRMDKLTEERQWIITQARKGRISEEDMELQLAGLELQATELRRLHRDKVAAVAMREQAVALKAWAGQYLQDVREALDALSADPEALSDGERALRFEVYGAARFLEKFDGDRLQALRWAILEEKRRTVRMLVDEVLVVKAPDGGKVVVPRLALEIPLSYASLAYPTQSLAYVEAMGETCGRLTHPPGGGC